MINLYNAYVLYRFNNHPFPRLSLISHLHIILHNLSMRFKLIYILYKKQT
jgi:hypothetical protein